MASGLSGGRLASLFALAALGFAVGFYLGIFLLLSVVGFASLQGWQFLLTTLPTGGLVAGASAAALSGGRTRLLVVAVTSAVLTALCLMVVDGDFVVAIVWGEVVVVTSLVLTALHRRETPGR